MPKTRYYVGVKDQKRSIFSAKTLPTEQSHGEQFNAVIGPFRTKRGAEFMCLCGHGNSHCQTVRDAERLSLNQRLPVRDDVTEIQYHRPPTQSEINFGHGAIHYRTFSLEECCHQGTRIPKKWIVAEEGLARPVRYYH